MQTVFRIQHKDTGKGMYRHTGRCLASICSSSYDVEYDRHPTPWEDSKLTDSILEKYDSVGSVIYNESPYLYGFISVDQLRSWLYRDEWLLGLHNEGYILIVVETDDVYTGNSQAVFTAPNGYVTHSIKEYFNLTDKEI